MDDIKMDDAMFFSILMLFTKLGETYGSLGHSQNHKEEETAMILETRQI